jgi:tetratricopeptide (TPR) repeat protein
MPFSSASVTFVLGPLKNKGHLGLALLLASAVLGTLMETVSQEQQKLIPVSPENPLLGGEGRLQPSGVGLGRWERGHPCPLFVTDEPTPTPSPTPLQGGDSSSSPVASQNRMNGSPEKSDAALAKQIAALEAELRARPTDVEVLLRLGKLYHQQGTFQKSTPLFERIIVLRPRHLDANILLGVDRFHAGQAREAIEPLKRAVELDLQNTEANFYLGLCFLSLDREDEATKAFDRLASQAPATVDELYLLTRAYSRLSSAMLSRLASLGENSYRMHQVRGEYFDLQNNPDQAIKEYEMAVQLRPDLPSLHYVLGSAYWKHSELDKAAAELRRAIELDPKHFTAHYKLGMVLLEQNDPRQAVAEFRIALAEQPGLNDGYMGLGKALFKLGENEAAAPQLLRYVQLSPLDPTPHYLLYQIFRRLNRSEEAQHELATFEEKEKQAKARKSVKIEERIVAAPVP